MGALFSLCRKVGYFLLNRQAIRKFASMPRRTPLLSPTTYFPISLTYDIAGV
jgi:hypothetical protein